MIERKVFSDVAINIIASVICTFVLNFLLYPLFSNRLNICQYGNIITIYSIIALSISTLGNTLNNIRLILNRKYYNTNKEGNYNLIAIFIGTLFGLFIPIIIKVLFDEKVITCCLIALTIIVGIIRAYAIVSYRLQLNYKEQLYTNIVVSFGYILGITVVYSYEYWPLPFLFGEFFGLCYCYFSCFTFTEPYVLTKHIFYIIKQYLYLICASFLGNLLAFMDRFLLFPILGADGVAIYSVASFWGRAVLPIIGPSANVLLSYLNQANGRITWEYVKKLIGVSFLLIVSMLLLSKVLANDVIVFFYPKLFFASKNYIFISSVGILLGCFALLLDPLVLSVLSMSRVLMLKICHILIYILIAYGLVCEFGLLGYCYSVIIVNALYILILIYICKIIVNNKLTKGV